MSNGWKGYPLPFMGRRRAPYKPYKLSLRADPCAYCHRPSEGLDHVVPRAQKGENKPTNVVGACSGCNSRKGDRKLLFFLLEERRRADAKVAA